MITKVQTKTLDSQTQHVYGTEQDLHKVYNQQPCTIREKRCSKNPSEREREKHDGHRPMSPKLLLIISLIKVCSRQREKKKARWAPPNVTKTSAHQFDQSMFLAIDRDKKKARWAPPNVTKTSAHQFDQSMFLEDSVCIQVARWRKNMHAPLQRFDPDDGRPPALCMHGFITLPVYSSQIG